MKKLVKKYSRSIITGVLAFLMMFQAVMPQISNTAYADSNDLRRNMLFMKSQQALNNIDVETLDMDAIRMLSLYLSNYYVPFGTTFDSGDLDSSGSDDKDDEEDKDKKDSKSSKTTVSRMQQALSDLGFDKETAQALVSLVYKASLETAKPLVYSASKDEMLYYKAEYEKITDEQGIGIVAGMLNQGRTKFNSNIAGDGLNKNFLSTPFVLDVENNRIKEGEILKRLSVLPDGTELPTDTYRLTYAGMLSMLANGIDKDFKYVDSSGKESDVIPFSSNDRVRSAYIITSEGAEMNYTKGGGSLSMLSSEQLKKLKDGKDFSNASSIGAQVYVDWVGNIIVDTGTCRTVALPACMNPYTFKIIGGNEGGRLNLVSTYGINMISKGYITRISNEGEKSDYKYRDARYGLFVEPCSGSILKQNYWRTFRGVDKVKFDDDSGVGAEWGKTNNVLLKLYARGLGLADDKYKNATGDDTYEGATDTLYTLGLVTNGEFYGLGKSSYYEDRAEFPCFAYYYPTEDTLTPINPKVSSSGIRGIGTRQKVYDEKNKLPHKDNTKYVMHNDSGTVDFMAFTQVLGFDNLNLDFEGKTWEGNVVSSSLLESATPDGDGLGYASEGCKSTFGTTGFEDLDSNFGKFADKIDKAAADALYYTYLYSYSNYIEGAHKEGATYSKDNNIDMVFNGDAFPTVADNKINWDDILNGMYDEDEMSDKLQAEVMSMIYYILHPVKGMHYFSTWAKTKISAFFLGWHEDMVGYTSSNTSTGMTKYIGFTGYTTLPNLYDMSWTNWMLENYNSIIVYLIIIMAVIMCCYVIVGSLTGQRALVGVFMFGFLAFLPPVAINMTVDIVNNMCDRIYGTKFTYWALVQHQSYLQDLYVATQNADNYAQFVLKGTYADEMNPKGGESTDADFASVKLKWMSPKKDNYMASFVKQVKDDMSSNASQTFLNNMLNIGGQSKSGEEFLDSDEALYLYRDYMNITMYSLKSYNLYDHYNGGGVVSSADGDYKMQVGYRWNASQEYSELGDIKYSSGLPFRNMVFVNYESDTNYNSQKNTDLHDVSSIEAVRKGFIYPTVTGTETQSLDYYGNRSYSISYLLNFPRAYDDIMLNKAKLDTHLESGTAQIGKDKLWGYGLPQNYFNFTQSDLSTNGGLRTEETDEGTKEVGIPYTKDNLDYFYYGLYSESPYYFMTYNILDQLNASGGYQFSLSKSNEVDIGSNGAFKDLLLGNNLEYFYNYSENSGDGYGELRDFMNMHDFFYYVLPLMDSGNQLVDTFDKAYGMEMYDDVKVTFSRDGNVLVSVAGETGQELIGISDIYGPRGDAIVKEEDKVTMIPYAEATQDWTNERVYKFWHNYNVATIFNAYSTWADTMYDCNYAKAETIRIGGKKYRVDNPLDPTSYFKYDQNTGKMTEGRPMVFSRSEMAYYGLQWSQLTTVEQKIITVQDNVYEKAIDLMNYYNFDDDVLVSSYAMLQLFEFNKEFSQTSLIGSDYIMYPQSYELKAFTYDAYLRLIVSNTTGDSLQTEENMSLYERTMKNSSITFGFLLIILDIICVYLIPAFKVFFLVVLFFMSILMIVSSAVKIELNIMKVTWQSLVSPLLSFGAISIGLAFVVSLFMSNGAKGVTGDLTPTVQLGDPTMVIAVMIVLNAVALYLYWKVCRKAFKDFITYTKAVLSNITGTVAGAFKTVAGVALAGGVLSAIKNRSTDGSGSLPRHDASRAGEENKPSPRITGGSGSGNEGGSGNGAVQPGDMPMTPAKTVKEQEGLDGATKDYDKKIKSGKSKREGTDDGLDAKDVAVAGGAAVAGSAVAAKLADADKPKAYNDKATQLERQAKERQKTINYRKERMSSVSNRREGTNYGAKIGAAVESVDIKKTQLQAKAYRGKAKVAQTRQQMSKSYNSAKQTVKTSYDSTKTRASEAMKSASTKAKNTVSKPVNSVKKKVQRQVDGYKYIRYKK